MNWYESVRIELSGAEFHKRMDDSVKLQKQGTELSGEIVK